MDGAAAKRLELVLRNDLSELQRLAAAVDGFVAGNGLPPDLAFRLTLCLDELVTNTVSYGYRDRTGDGTAGPHEIRVRLEAQAHELRAEVEDDADAFDPFADRPPPDLSGGLESRRVGGLGLFLIGKTMDRGSYRREGGRNLVLLAKSID